ncbi:hypothetical protein [Halobellus sp. EA9]|uniref:hypothetical protein n=1 Tax=Halobellus sp. EA9 TaxID=3421647 RepID=UPI003EBD5ED6
MSVGCVTVSRGGRSDRRKPRYQCIRGSTPAGVDPLGRLAQIAASLVRDGAASVPVAGSLVVRIRPRRKAYLAGGRP